MGFHSDANCAECPLKDRPLIPSDLQREKPIDVLFIGEAGAQEEVVQGKPFVGQSGQILWTTFGTVGIARDQCGVTNAVLCRPKGKNPEQAEVDCCLSRLQKELSDNPSKVIVPLGNVALAALTGRLIKDVRISKERGRLTERSGIPLVPTYHPMSMFYADGAFPDFARDAQMIRKIVDGTLDQKFLPVPSVTVITTIEGLRKLILQVATRAAESEEPLPIAVDLETTGFDHKTDRILCMSLAVAKTRGIVIAEELFNSSETDQALRNFFNIDNVAWVYQNGKFDAQFLWTFIGEPVRVDEDTMLMHYTLDERKGTHGLKDLASEWEGAPDYENEIKKHLKKKSDSYALVPRDLLYKYAAYDAAYTLRLYYRFRDILNDDQNRFYHRVLIPATNAMVHLERAGVLVDREKLDSLSDYYTKQINEIEATLFKLAGHEFNPRSPVQVSKVMFNELNLPKIRGSSTNAEVLEALQEHEFAQQLLEHRRVSKLDSTYVRGLWKDIHEDKKIHPSYLLHGAVSRTSCMGPNFQNQPQDAELRQIYIAQEGWEFGEIDYSQNEFRGVAFYSGDEFLRNVYLEDGDLHDTTSDTLNVNRKVAKAVNFGLLYQRSAFSLASQLGCSVPEAEDFIEQFFDRMPDVRAWISSVQKTVLSGKPLISKLGRYRRFGLITSNNREDIMRECVNFLPQATGSDTALMALSRISTEVDQEVFRPTGFIHDSVVFVVRKDAREILRQVKIIAEETPRLALETDLPFKVDIKLGPSWGAMEKFDPS